MSLVVDKLSRTLIVAALVACGAAHAEPETAGAIRVTTPAPGQPLAFGIAVAALDFDGDGINEIAVSDTRETAGQVARGVVYVYKPSPSGYQAFTEYSLNNASAGFGQTLAVGDFDEDGRDDLLIGTPGLNSGGGGVYLVRHTSPTNTTQVGIIVNGGASGGACGTSLAVGDFDDDGHLDFATGCPFASFDAFTSVGRVEVARGLGNGNFSLGFLSQDSAGVGGGPETGDAFGYSLAAADFDCDDAEDLAVGVPFENVDGGTASGAVHVLFGADPGGLSGAGSQLWHQGIADVPGTSGNEDHFAWALAAGQFDGNTLDFGNCDDLAIGVPDDVENPGGSVLVLSGRRDMGLVTAGALVIDAADFPPRQGVIPLRSMPGTDNRLGVSLIAGNLGGDPSEDLAIGVEGYGVILQPDRAGFVCIAYAEDGDGLLLEGQRCYNGTELGGTAATDKRFGLAVAMGNVDGVRGNDLVVGSPGGNQAFVLKDVLFRNGFEGHAD